MTRSAPDQTALPRAATGRGRLKGRLSRRAAARLRLARRQALAWKRRLRRAATLALAVGLIGQPLSAHGQLGQSSMGQPAGLANGVVGRIGQAWQGLNDNGPGYLYYGLNPADRGLGYIGSYMTLGGFIPYAEDDLGGLWAADLRTHLSVYGGFFSNVGAVRKQLLGGGSLLGVGVYWDYDGDLNQNPTNGQLGTETFGQFGHVYNQVGVSGELLTDWGNLRSNGYMPVGSTSYTVGAPGSPFYQNYIVCQNGLDAALGGADLELGAYLPGLADWAGMINVGGYALGNTTQTWQTGTKAGQAVVPWFGGVYTRLDLTFANNWDFSIQANNDSFFDWTGFCRLTYRMGGSRRRNVPDQMEQPMFRNEHIVRGHQTPVLVANPQNSNALWNVIHVNNAAAAGGNGTAEAPFTTLQEAQAAATNPWDIVYVNEGTSTLLSGTTYGGTFAFKAANQSLVGSGGNFVIAAQSGCGTLVNGNWLYTIAAQTAANPVLSNPAGASLGLNGQGGLTLANLTITGSQTAILASGNLTGTAQPAGTTANPSGTTKAGATSVRNVAIAGDGTGNPQRGVFLTTPTGSLELTDTTIGNMNNTSFRVDGGSANIDYSGTITSDIATNGGTASTLIDINTTTGGTINLASGGAPSGSVVPNAISDIGGFGIFLESNSNAEGIRIGNVSLTDNANTAILVAGDNGSKIQITADSGTGIIKRTPGAAIAVDEGSPSFEYYGPVSNTPTSGIGYLLQVNKMSGGQATVGGPGDILSPYALSDSGNGILIQGTTGGTVNVSGADLASKGTQALLVNNSTGTFNFTDINVTGGTSNAVLLTDLSGSTTQFTNLNIATTNANAAGFAASNAATVNVLNANSLTTVSTIKPAINVFGPLGSTTLDLNFNSVTSGVASGTGAAIILEETGAGGTIAINGALTVGGAAGTGADVTNTSQVTVSVNGVQISP